MGASCEGAGANVTWFAQSGDDQEERWYISPLTGWPTAGCQVRWEPDGVHVLEYSRITLDGLPATQRMSRAKGLHGDVSIRHDPELPGIVVRVGDREVGMADGDWTVKR